MKKLIYGLLICLIAVTIVVVYTTPEKPDASPSSSYPSSSKTEYHSCYVCGESCNLKYGSFYYCSTHWAMVKTVNEAG